MKSNVAAQRADEDDLEAAMSPAELAALKAAIARADEQYARGEGMPASVLLADFDRILAGG
ncbi:MAG TPA: hypothetical protein VE093_34720 [Polyangiaceae bacterium]|nr:hypothetical protein [Polyangiaceae bacterium]